MTTVSVPHRRFPALGLLLAVVVVGALAAPLRTGSTTAQEATPAVAPYAPPEAVAEIDGRLILDGSSTVWPVSAEVAERFAEIADEVVVEVEVSGTGGGFRRFCAGDSDIQNASRPITEEERATCEAAGVAYHRFDLGFDGITVGVSQANDFVDCLSVDQLRRLWQADDPARTWRDLDPAWPDREIELYGPGLDSGTFDYFTATILGADAASRVDYTPSEDDRILVDGVADDADALGYFGYAYYLDTQDRLKRVAVDNGAGCVTPTRETIGDGSYAPLSRPLFLYVNRDSLGRPEVQEFVRFYLASAPEVVAAVGYAPAATYAANQAELEAAIGGTIPPDGPAADAAAVASPAP